MGRAIRKREQAATQERRKPTRNHQNQGKLESLSLRGFKKKKIKEKKKKKKKKKKKLFTHHNTHKKKLTSHSMADKTRWVPTTGKLCMTHTW